MFKVAFKICFDVNDNHDISIRMLGYGIVHHFVMIDLSHLIASTKSAGKRFLTH